MTGRLALLVVLAALAGPAPAGAAEYTVVGCAREPASLAGWAPSSSGGHALSHTDACDRGGGFGAGLTPGEGRPSGAAGWTYGAAPDTGIGGVTLWRAASVAVAGSYDGGAEWHGYSWEVRDWLRGYTAVTLPELCFGGAACAPLGADPRLSWRTNRGGLTGISLNVVCRTLPGGTCPGSARAASFVVARSEIALEDPYPPAFVASPGGTLLDPAAPLTGVQSVAVHAADRGGGVLEAAVEVDGVVRATEPLASGTACAPPFRRRVPCPAEARRTFAFDVAGLADGQHQVRILVRDATGVNTAASAPVTVATRAAGAPNGTPATSDARLRAVKRARGRKARRSLTLPAGRRARLTGRLTSASGTPIAGAVVVLAERLRGASAWRALPPVRTGEGGGFSAVLPAGGARTVRAGYRVGTAAPAYAVTATVGLRVRAGVWLRGPARARRGREFTLEGGLAFVPGRPKLIEIQAREGRRWRTIATVRSKRRGRFSYRQRFRRPGPAGRYAFRARAPVEAGYPFLAGASSRLLVTVR